MIRFNVSSARRYYFLICITLLCYLIGSILIGIIQYKGLTPMRLSISMILQDIVMFIIPALVTAMVVTRRPADLLQLTTKPHAIDILLVILLSVVSIPVMNVVIECNKSLALPESLSGIEQWMLTQETRANEMIGALVDGNSIASLTMMLLIIGVFAGFSEELFFRGILQQTIKFSPANAHVAVWISAFIFSAIHLQFYGFIPRLLLGAAFGYFALWSGSIWLAVIAHIVNNIEAALSLWIADRGCTDIDFNNIGVDGSPLDYVLAIGSAVLIIVLLFTLHYRHKKAKAENR